MWTRYAVQAEAETHMGGTAKPRSELMKDCSQDCNRKRQNFIYIHELNPCLLSIDHIPWRFTHSFILQLLDKYLLSIYHAWRSVPDAGDTEVSYLIKACSPERYIDIRTNHCRCDACEEGEGKGPISHTAGEE